MDADLRPYLLTSPPNAESGSLDVRTAATDRLDAFASVTFNLDMATGRLELVPTRRMFKAALTSLSTNLLDGFLFSPPQDSQQSLERDNFPDLVL